MAPRRGRRAPRAAAGLSAARAAGSRPLAALGILLAALAVLRAAQDSGPAAAAVPAAAAPTALGVPLQDPAPPPPRDVGLAERSAREDALRAIAARWTEEARRRSGGVAHAGTITVSVLAREVGPLRTGTLASLDPDVPLAPASNAKLATTAAALALLGPDWTFATRVEAGGPIERGVLRGDLVVRAGGDPLHAPDGRVEARLDALARAVRAAGAGHVTGDLVLDEGPFGPPEPAPGWPDAGQRWADYCALAGGFTLNGGVLHATATPLGGGAARVEVHPAPHGLRERYDVRFGGPHDVRVGATATTCTVRGTLPAGLEGWSAEFAHPDPVGLFGAVLLDRLERAGVVVDGEVVRRRGVPPGRPLGALESRLVDTLVPINTHSENGVADQVFLAVGAAVAGEGTRAGGMRATRLALERLGVPADGLVQVDGSGLSRDNRATARQLVALLEAVLAQEDATARAFVDSLAVAGQSGTLAERMRGTPAEGRVFAKTGWIAGSSALAGLVRAPDGRRVLFSILVGYPRRAGGLNTQVFKPMQDEMVLHLLAPAP